MEQRHWDMLWAGALALVIMLVLFLPPAHCRRVVSAGAALVVLAFCLAGLGVLVALIGGVLGLMGGR